MLHGIPEFDVYYVAYLKDDPAQEPDRRKLQRTRSARRSSAQDGKGKG
jgi:hypothetical protein